MLTLIILTLLSKTQTGQRLLFRIQGIIPIAVC